MIEIEALNHPRVLCRTLIYGDRGVVPMQLVDLSGNIMSVTPFMRETAGTIFCDGVVVALRHGHRSTSEREIFTLLAGVAASLRELDTMAIWRFVEDKKIAADVSTPTAEITLVALRSINRTTSGYRC